ncbi:MAG: hypothetical protein H8E53_03105, partial [Planctomycetes bacterium]|nr:hypothetical protein [Planctomycetota bacterium]
MKRYGIMSMVVVLAVALSATWSFAESRHRGRRGRDDDKKPERSGDRDKDAPKAKAPQEHGPQRGFQGRGPRSGFFGRGPQRGFPGQGPSEEMKRRFAEMRKRDAEESKAKPKSREEFIKRMHEEMRKKMSQHKDSGPSKARGESRRSPRRGFSGRGPSEEMKRRFAEMHKRGAEASKAKPKSREEFFKKMHEEMRKRMSQHKDFGSSQARGESRRGSHRGFSKRGNHHRGASRGGSSRNHKGHFARDSQH